MNSRQYSKFFAILVALSLVATLLGSAAFPTSVRAATGYIAITAGGNFTCGLTTGGAVMCWGANNNGQLGDGTIIERHTPVQVYGLASGVIAISAGFAHSCALNSLGGVKCWGSNFNGELGDNTNINRLKPVQVYGLASGVSAIAAGGWHTCAVTTSGRVKCWGANWAGQLGDGTFNDKWRPYYFVTGLLSGVSDIAAGHMHTCAVKSGGAKCWGDNAAGQLGNNSTTGSNIPVNVSGLASGVSAISIGGGGFYTCVRTTAGGAKCWGANNNGQLGDGTTTTPRKMPVSVYHLTSGVSAIAAGSVHTCARTAVGGAKCWGSNANGRLGNNSTIGSNIPVDVYGLASGVDAIANGDTHSCALTSGGGIKCWGANGNGQLGNNLIIGSKIPVNVAQTRVTITYRSTGSQDGWVLEAGQTLSPADTNTSEYGGSLNSTATLLRLGDDAAKKQYRSILSFSTGASLPDTAVITLVSLRIKKAAVQGVVNPVTTFQGFMVDLKNGFYGTSAALQTGDFQAPASRTIGPFTTALVSGYYSINLTSASGFINKWATGSGLTQIRLRFKLGDNNNTTADILSLFSGDTLVVADRPLLIITYYMP